MTNRFRDDIRRIAETDDLKKRIKPAGERLDKASIKAQRGIGVSQAPFDPCKTLYSADDGVYSMEGVIDGTEGPKLVDGERNECQQVNTIKGMYDLDDTDRKIVLKPDGVFLNEDFTYYYTSDIINYMYSLDDTVNLFYDTVEKAANMSESFYIDLLSDPSFKWDVPLSLVGITDEAIGDHNFGVNYPVYFLAPKVAGYPQWDIVFGYPISYDSELDTFSSGKTPQLYDAPAVGVATPTGGISYVNSYPGSMYQYFGNEYWGAPSSDLKKVSEYAGFQLALKLEQGRWMPNPDSEVTYPTQCTNGVSIVHVGFGDPDDNRIVNIIPGKDGGFIIFEATLPVPSTVIRVYRSDRTLSAVSTYNLLSAYVA